MSGEIKESWGWKLPTAFLPTLYNCLCKHWFEHKHFSRIFADVVNEKAKGEITLINI